MRANMLTLSPITCSLLQGIEQLSHLSSDFYSLATRLPQQNRLNCWKLTVMCLFLYACLSVCLSVCLPGWLTACSLAIHALRSLYTLGNCWQVPTDLSHSLRNVTNVNFCVLFCIQQKTFAWPKRAQTRCVCVCVCWAELLLPRHCVRRLSYLSNLWQIK